MFFRSSPVTVFLRELSALYSAFVQRRPSPLMDLPVQYADFASWQSSAAASDNFHSVLPPMNSASKRRPP